MFKVIMQNLGKEVFNKLPYLSIAIGAILGLRWVASIAGTSITIDFPVEAFYLLLIPFVLSALLLALKSKILWILTLISYLAGLFFMGIIMGIALAVLLIAIFNANDLSIIMLLVGLVSPCLIAYIYIFMIKVIKEYLA